MKYWFMWRFRSLAVCLIWLLLCISAHSQTLTVTIVDQNDKPLADAVAYVVAIDKPVSSAPSTAVIDQVDKEFIPYVSVVQTGTEVSFPNNDKIRHQVYSFSDAKTFEIPLYAGTPAAPIRFDRAGVISVGCNIHDWMTSHILVVDTPYFAISNELGVAEILPLLAGQYQVNVWHPKMASAGQEVQRTLQLSELEQEITFTIKTKPVWRAWRAPNNFNSGGYR